MSAYREPAYVAPEEPLPPKRRPAFDNEIGRPIRYEPPRVDEHVLREIEAHIAKRHDGVTFRIERTMEGFAVRASAYGVRAARAVDFAYDAQRCVRDICDAADECAGEINCTLGVL